ncbi:hypothetical protein V1525DRAFT_99439 [Lipomyces kononenkoae]|uniref:Uncharacterized protein n=1 Tax=Lipomyces kononenkoae TaxID=34357 RepID=A0ACC3T4F1_LIPKO
MQRLRNADFCRNVLSMLCADQDLHEYLQGIDQMLREYDAFRVGEMPGVHDSNEILKPVGEDRGISDGIQFRSRARLEMKPSILQYSAVEQIINKWQTFMLENHGWKALYMETTISHERSPGSTLRRSPRTISGQVHLPVYLASNQAPCLFTKVKSGLKRTYHGSGV